MAGSDLAKNFEQMSLSGFHFNQKKIGMIELSTYQLPTAHHLYSGRVYSASATETVDPG